MIELMQFQKRFIAEALKPEIDTAVLSIPRGNGKSTLAAYILAKAITPGEIFFESGKEFLLTAASLSQCRIVFNAMLEFINLDDYKIINNTRELKATHKATGTALFCLPSNAKNAMGLGINNPLIVCDEPASWKTTEGYLMFQALRTCIGKPNARTKLIFIGTISPANRGWFRDLVESKNSESRYIQVLSGRDINWNNKRKLTNEIRRVNPLKWKFKDSRKKLLSARDNAMEYKSEQATFNSYLLNSPTQEESEQLLKPIFWKQLIDQEVLAPEGYPIVGVDLGESRSFSAAVAIYPNGYIDAIALAPGQPSIEEQEIRDRVPRGVYQKLVDKDLLLVDEGKLIPDLDLLIERLNQWKPTIVLCDRFRLNYLIMNAPHLNIRERVVRYSEASEDINALRKLAANGKLNIGLARDLVEESLAVSIVKSDDQGNTRLTKSNKFNRARDDIAQALVLAAGEYQRQQKKQSKVNSQFLFFPAVA